MERLTVDEMLECLGEYADHESAKQLIAMIEELMTDIFRGEPLIANDQQPSEVTARYKQLLDRIDHEFYSITFCHFRYCKPGCFLSDFQDNAVC